jgi:hypothetical protein
VRPGSCFSILALCLLTSLTPLFAQAPVSFSTVKSGGQVTNETALTVYAVDVNDDGIPDAVITTAQQLNFGVSIANGDGSFRAPVFYNFASPGQYTFGPIAFGDFNGDGHVDIVATPLGSRNLEVFLGNGDGTFQASRHVSAALPAGQSFYLATPILAADFNKDGKLDLIAAASTLNNTSQYLYVLPGDGTGGFGAPHLIFTPPSGSSFSQGNFALGDFDADGRADVAVTTTTFSNRGDIASTTLHVLYGNGALGFSATAPFNFAGQFNVSSGDLNSDGRTDLFGITYGNTDYSGPNRLTLLYSQPSRTFATYTTSAPAFVGGSSPNGLTPGLTGPLAMADFNGDGKMDLVASIDYYQNGSINQLAFFLAGATPGAFTTQLVNLSGYTNLTNPAVGDFNQDNKPDVLVAQSNVGNSAPDYLTAALNRTGTGNWGRCKYPSGGQLIGLCLPSSTSTTSPVRFAAAANSFGDIRKMELWIDGKKIAEQHHTWGQRAYFDFTQSVANGSHRATIFSADIDSRQQSLVYPFSVGTSSGCTAPSTAGVHICSPASGVNISSPVAVQATATVTGTFSHMELWVDGVKKYSESSSKTLTTSISLAAGAHRLAVLALNTAGAKWETAVNITVQ